MKTLLLTDYNICLAAKAIVNILFKARSGWVSANQFYVMYGGIIAAKALTLLLDKKIIEVEYLPIYPGGPQFESSCRITFNGLWHAYCEGLLE